MKKLSYTSDAELMVAYGKEIFKEKSDIYTETIIQDIYDVINRWMPKASSEEKDNLFYRSIYDYWVYGNSIKEEFYYDFVHKTHEEKMEYLTFRTRFLYYNYLNTPSGAEICSNKWLSYQKFGEFYGRDVILIESEQDYETFVSFVAKHKEFVVKPINLGMAQGVHKVEVEEDTNNRLLFYSLLEENNAIVEKHKWGGQKKGIILEEVIHQTEVMNQIHPQSINGVRCITLRINNEPTIYHPWMMVGTNGDFLVSGDLNYHLAGVNAETGVVNTPLYNEWGNTYEKHPTTGVQILGFEIPRWNELVETVKKLSDMLPEVRYIGWDMVLTDEYGWVVMEANECGEPLWQIVEQKGDRRNLEETIGFKPEGFWWEK